MKECSLVIIARPTPEEVAWMQRYRESTERRFKEEVVVRNEFIVRAGQFSQTVFIAENLDGQVSRKKNLGVLFVTEAYTLVCHADAYPHETFFDVLQQIDVGENEVLCPRGLMADGTPGLTHAWKDPDGNCWNANIPELPEHALYTPGISYISGAAIFARTETFRRHRWNEALRWGQEDDIEYSRRLEANGVTLRYEPRLLVDMKRSQ